jgi:adenine/guanine phosphoribosyltransferase-like PRPP-binding protein
MSFRKGESGNPGGRPKGIVDSRHRLRAALEPHADALLAQAVEMARSGDVAVLTFLLGRAMPAPKPETAPINVEIPDGTLTSKAEALVAAAASGVLPASTAAELLGGLATVARLREVDELEARIATLEAGVQAKAPA